MKAGEIAGLLEKFSPCKYACDWDNVGMHVGRKDNEINRILVTVDVDDAAISKAVEIGAGMIVSHHPLIFHGLQKVNEDDFIGKRVLTLLENRINCYCMHTNFDCIGMADAAAELIGLKDTEVLEEILDGEGIGRIGTLEKPVTVKALCETVKKVYGLEKVVLYGDENAIVSKAAICPGAGKDDIIPALEKGAGVIITGDVTYHYGIDSFARGINVIDAGHYGIEHIFIDIIGDYLEKVLTGVDVVRMEVSNPQKFI